MLSFWLNKYPVLKEGLPLCSCEKHFIRPYKTDKNIGIQCQKCNTAVWTRAKKEDNQYLLNLLTKPYIDNKTHLKIIK